MVTTVRCNILTNSLAQHVWLLCKLNCLNITKWCIVTQHLTVNQTKQKLSHLFLKLKKNEVNISQSSRQKIQNLHPLVQWAFYSVSSVSLCPTFNCTCPNWNCLIRKMQRSQTKIVVGIWICEFEFEFEFVNLWIWICEFEFGIWICALVTALL